MSADIWYWGRMQSTDRSQDPLAGLPHWPGTALSLPLAFDVRGKHRRWIPSLPSATNTKLRWLQCGRLVPVPMRWRVLMLLLLMMMWMLLRRRLLLLRSLLLLLRLVLLWICRK